MYCPYCNNGDTKVLESRLLDDAMRRRRECLQCENRFTTYEKAVFNFTVIKKDLSEQPFVMQKVTKSIEKACAKAEPELVSQISKKVQQKILSKKLNPIKTNLIGKFVLQELKKVDKIAYLRYASIYKDIDDPKLLEKELQTIAG